MRYAICALFLLAVGCGVKPPIEGRMDPYAPPQIAFASPGLANATAVGLPQMERKDGILFVTVPIRSTVDHDLHVDYRYTFFNAEGTILSQSSWVGGTVLVHNVPSEIRFNSLSGDAYNCRMDIRYSQ